MKKLALTLLALALLAGRSYAATVDEENHAKHESVAATLPHIKQGPICACKFDDKHQPPTGYYSRGHQIPGECLSRGITNALEIPADEVIHDAPQNERGFLTGWLEPGQKIITLTQRTLIEYVDHHCGRTMLWLEPGESVVIDESICKPTDDGGKTCEILAVIRCANKVLQGRAYLPPPEVIEKQVEKIVKEREEVRVEVEKPCPPVVAIPRVHKRFWCLESWWKGAICASPALLLLRSGGGSHHNNGGKTPDVQPPDTGGGCVYGCEGTP